MKFHIDKQKLRTLDNFSGVPPWPLGPFGPALAWSPSEFSYSTGLFDLDSVFHQWGHPKSMLVSWKIPTSNGWWLGYPYFRKKTKYKGGWDSPTVFHQLVLYLPIRPAVFCSLVPLGMGSPSSMELDQNVYQWVVENTAIRRGPPIRFQNCLAREVLPSKIGDVCKNNVNTQWNCPPSVVQQCDPSKQSCLRSKCNMSNNQTNILGRWVVYNRLQENVCCFHLQNQQNYKGWTMDFSFPS